MSYEIEYQRVVFVKDPELEQGDYDNCLYAFWQHGSNNCYEADSNRRARSWDFYAAGPPYVVIRAACQNAGYTESGGLKVNGRWTTPERYIKLWRKAIASAVSIAELPRRVPITHGRLMLYDEMPELDSWTQERLDGLRASDDWHEGKDFYEHPYLERVVTGVEGLDDWLQARSYSFVSHSYVL